MPRVIPANAPAYADPVADEPLHLLDTTMLYSPTGGGVVRYLQAKRRWLARHTRVRHTLLVPGPHSGSGRNGETFLRCNAVPGVRYRIPADTRSWSRAIAMESPDLVEVGDPGPVAIAAFRARRVARMPVVAFCHSDIERNARLRFGRVASRAVRAYARIVYGEADHVLAPSDYMRRQLARWGITGCSVCPLGVDLDCFHPSRRQPALRAWLGLPTSTRLLVFAGRFAPEKRLSTLFDAFERLGRPYHLLLIGDGALPALPANVSVVPFQHEPARLAAWLGGADALVHAGDQETFGLAIAEALACGLPVVATADGATPEIVTPDCGILVRPQRPPEFADAIAALYAADRATMGRRARQRAEERYGWDTVFRTLLGVYATVARARPALGHPTVAAA